VLRVACCVLCVVCCVSSRGLQMDRCDALRFRAKSHARSSMTLEKLETERVVVVGVWWCGAIVGGEVLHIRI
jgi:hypothetical protein